MLGDLGVRLEGLRVQLEGLGVRLEGLGVRLGGLGVRLEGLGVRLGGLGVTLGGLGVRLDLGMMLEGLGVRLGDLGVRLEGLGVSLGMREETWEQEFKALGAKVNQSPGNRWKPNYVKYLLAAISPDGLLCQCREHRAWQGCRSALGVNKGETAK